MHEEIKSRGMWHAWERGGTCKGFWWESPKGKRALGRPRCRWEDGLKMDLRETGWRGVEWIHLAQDRDRWRAVANEVMNLRVVVHRVSISPKMKYKMRWQKKYI
jgi:hypothetical protein